jgi:hypothetical protein
MATIELTNLDKIDNKFIGISRKIVLTNLSEIRLNKIKYRKLFFALRGPAFLTKLVKNT